ncbi:MAG: DUF1801 domain-containing protein [Tabrizicola sp.]|jgi:hypothetical protein|nr:DUF1801 domain-containing protein [Tabrizicola sp.]
MRQAAKTTSAPLDRAAWLAGVEAARRPEAERLLEIFATTTRWEPRLWGPSIVGFGRYVYRYDSGHAGESLVVGFSPRTAEISLYGLTGGAEAEALLPALGPHRTGKACLYVRRLAAVDAAVLTDLIRSGVKDMAVRWPVFPL